MFLSLPGLVPRGRSRRLISLLGASSTVVQRRQRGPGRMFYMYALRRSIPLARVTFIIENERTPKGL